MYICMCPMFFSLINCIMEAYKKVVDLKNNTLELQLPDSFKNKKVEVFVVAVEGTKNTQEQKPSDFKGSISKETASELLNYVEESRNQWERDF